ncbi:CopG family transcriptional regulator [Candidatus Palauibacter sp.]|uniref:ribbon-helix-helix domain-containing protein n=1 Tax=Candidatus Palauibacter sp. TaxID=3101350 RepID=UPI003B02BD11
MKKQTTRRTSASHRTSVSFPPELYETLAGIARQKKVSVAWVVRDAAEKYVADRWPLLPTDQRTRA